jgi:hypothetical protein
MNMTNSEGSVAGFSPLLQNMVSRCYNPQFLNRLNTFPRVVANPQEFCDKWWVDIADSYLDSGFTTFDISSHEVVTIDQSSFRGGVKFVVGNILDLGLVSSPHTILQFIPKDVCVDRVVTFSCDVATSLPNVRIRIGSINATGGTFTEFANVRGDYKHPGDGRLHRLWVSTLCADAAYFSRLVLKIECGGFTPYTMSGGSLTLFEAGNCSFAIGGYEGLPYIPKRDVMADEVFYNVATGATVRTVKQSLDELYNELDPLLPDLSHLYSITVNGCSGGISPTHPKVFVSRFTSNPATNGVVVEMVFQGFGGLVTGPVYTDVFLASDYLPSQEVLLPFAFVNNSQYVNGAVLVRTDGSLKILQLVGDEYVDLPTYSTIISSFVVRFTKSIG